MGTIYSAINHSSILSACPDNDGLDSASQLRLILGHWIRHNKLNIPYRIFPLSLLSTIVQFIYQSNFDLDLSCNAYSDSNQETDHAEFDNTFKVVLVGNQGVGKSAIAHKWLYGDSMHDTSDNNGYFATRQLSVARANTHSQQCTICLWDTAGAPKFESLIPIYARCASCIVFVYDMTNKQSLLDLTHWIQAMDEANDAVDHAVKVLIANKCDMAHANEREDSDEAHEMDEMQRREKQLVSVHQIQQVWHISATQDHQYVVHEIFEEVARLVLKQREIGLKRHDFPFFG